MTKSSLNRIVRFPYAGFAIAIIFCVWVLASEYGSASIGGDFGGFSWVTFHFILNPTIGILLSIFLIFVAIKQDRLHAKIVSFISIGFPLFITYVGFTGNIWFVELVGINLR